MGMKGRCEEKREREGGEKGKRENVLSRIKPLILLIPLSLLSPSLSLPTSPPSFAPLPLLSLLAASFLLLLIALSKSAA